MASDKMCDSCKFWKFDGSLSYPPRASNEGICGFFLDAERSEVPMWVEDLARATISFHGRECRAWERKPKPVTKILKKTTKHNPKGT